MRILLSVGLLLCFGVTSTVEAGGYRYYSRSCYTPTYYSSPTYCAPTYIEPTYVNGHAVTPYNPFYIERIYGIPTFSAVYRVNYSVDGTSYGGGGVESNINRTPTKEEAPSWAKDLVDSMKSIKDSQLGMDKRLRLLEDRVFEGKLPKAPPTTNEKDPGVFKPPPPTSQLIKPVAKLSAPECAKCHEAAVAKTDGGSFTMFKGTDLVEFTEQQVGEIIRRVLLPNDHKHRMPKGRPFSPERKVKFLEDFSKALGLEQEESSPQPMRKEE